MILRTQGLVKEYGGRRVVDDVSLEVGEGQVVGLLGPNGAGKTTTFHMIVGLVAPQAGDPRPLPQEGRWSAAVSRPA